MENIVATKEQNTKFASKKQIHTPPNVGMHISIMMIRTPLENPKME
jgi:hypothetical protein